MNPPLTNPRIIRLKFSQPKINLTGEPAPPRPHWTLKRWLWLVAIIFAAHVAAIFIFGSYKFPAPLPVTNAPHFQLADDSSEILALENPTLFAAPRAGDLASVGLQVSDVRQPEFRWSESPHFLPLPSQMLGAAFHQFMQTNATQTAPLEFKPPPKLSAPTVSLPPAFAEHSTLQIEGDLAQRKLSGKTALPDWPYADVIAPSRVQVVVNEGGDVLSAVLLPLNSPMKNEIRYDAADQRALEIARGLQFTPAPHLTVGRVIFNWRTVPPPATNSADGQ